jgi:arylsulfatase A-like enzyme
MRRNVVLLVMDTARADACEPFGAAVGSTPTLAQMARSGRALPWVRSTANWTVPGHGSLFSGHLPRALGLGQVSGGRAQCRVAVSAVGDRWLPEVLRRAGYATAGVSTNLWISKGSGFASGFEQFVEVISDRNAKIADPHWRSRLAWDLEAVRATLDDGAERASEVVQSWLATPDERPFFWFVNLTECHSPYLPPKPYNDLSALNRLRAAEDARRYLTLEAIWRTCAGGPPVPVDAIDRMRHLYARSVRSMDDWVARLLEALDAAGRLDDTLVLVTSDHGENLGENGLIGHAFSLDDRLLRVPFIASDPTFPDLSSLASLPAVLCTMLGIDDHPFGAPSNGAVSIAEMDGLSGRDDPRVETAREMWDLDDEAITRMSSSYTCAADGELKLLRRDDGVETIFDVSADPLELRPVDAPGGAGDGGLTLRVNALRAAIEASQSAPVVPAARSLAGERFAEEDDDIADRMRLLGYL